MTSNELRNWQASEGLTNLAASAALRVSVRTYSDWIHGVSRTTGKQIKVPPLVGLACAAYSAGLGDWDSGEFNNFNKKGECI